MSVKAVLHTIYTPRDLTLSAHSNGASSKVIIGLVGHLLPKVAT